MEPSRILGAAHVPAAHVPEAARCKITAFAVRRPLTPFSEFALKYFQYQLVTNVYYCKLLQ
jgi:hypothetical protein